MTTRRDVSRLLTVVGCGALASEVGARSRKFGDKAKSFPTKTLSLAGRVHELSLDGQWQAGFERIYDRELKVPGLATDPAKPSPGTLWYKRTVMIPVGQWRRATLILKGARFAPEVYLNGIKVSASEGGMAPTHHRFDLLDDTVGKPVTVEIALKSLKDLDPKDASAVPGADSWRSNVSSYLWDSVALRLHGAGEIIRVMPTSHIKADEVSLDWQVDAVSPKAEIRFCLVDAAGATVLEGEPNTVQHARGRSVLRLKGRVKPWSPEKPNLYRLRAELSVDGVIVDALEQNFGLREFAVEGLGFHLNAKPYHIRMGTVVWHRWTRDPEARDIAFDTAWFKANIVDVLKRMGANGLRFHLGLPPEALLDLCDRHGLAVQMEWSFFHGINSTSQSMALQWQSWLDVATRHPSVVIIHPWNETEGEQLKMAHAAIEPLLDVYPPIVMSHRELTPVHKYWWSLFENLGLYYDSPAQFGQAVMVDEFGGNYLDGEGNPGGYPTTRETFLRFLGRNHSREERLQLQADANARVAEYWRRLGVAGFSPFDIMGSREDGSHWWIGPTNVAKPKPKPVWQALAAAFARQSLSLEVWNRNFAPGERITLPLWFFNEAEAEFAFSASLHVVDLATGKDAMPPIEARAIVKALSTSKMPITLALPDRVGEWRLEARLKSPLSPSGPPVVSEWRIRTFVPQASALLQTTAIGVAIEETELRAMLSNMKLKVVLPTDPAAKVILGSRKTWQDLHQPDMLARFDARLRSGVAIVLIDAGPQPLGVGYVTGKQLGGPLEGVPVVYNPAMLEDVTLFGGVKISFVEVAEPESTLQPAADSKVLWDGVPKEATWLWNGLRGGLIVPAADMQITGLSGKALLSVWEARGADITKITKGQYIAYELAGYYAYSDHGDDPAISDGLRRRVKFLVEDAPALASVVNPNAPITKTDLNALYRQSQTGGEAESLTPLANAGKNLSRTPVAKLGFGPKSGQLVISQLLTAGRLLPDYAEDGPGVYGRRYDPVAVQFVLNMIETSLNSMSISPA